MSSSKEIGEEWETELARKVGGRKVAASGSKWHSKLDVRGRRTIWSAKATEAASFRVDADMLREMRTSVATPGALGVDVTPILAVRTGAGDEVVVIQIDDFLALISSDELHTGPKITPKSRDRSPQLFRESED